MPPREHIPFGALTAWPNKLGRFVVAFRLKPRVKIEEPIHRGLKSAYLICFVLISPAGGTGEEEARRVGGSGREESVGLDAALIPR